ncbi:hypothetical protein CSIM01_07237 [Colletotrichum simmondsii]|uniref:Heterokaryon incompatibility domain-containing protein n=1 Tax=Colletotrichum simmondsii TaxID=703756 RepID=A0A135RQ00_9PEZI|nr:hypothetical protein CSIM01_07237 [Colletotrichum simmondsii]
MFSWHDKSCKSLSIGFSEELGLPICAGDKCVAPRLGRTRAAPEIALPVPAPKTTFELTWPSSLNLVDRETSNLSLAKEGSAEPKPCSLDDAGQNVVSHPGQHTTSQQKLANNSPLRDENSYQPLVARKTRLLDLIGGSYHDPIRIELQIADLLEWPKYEALSYTWADENGDSSKCERAYIGKRWDILPITKNCFNALRRLRYEDRARRLWVDAICINQNDVGERSHQVGIMQDIYNYAERVLIYLGEDADEPETANSSPWNYYSSNHRPLPPHIDLTQKPYFRRVWVIQEIAAAKDAWVLFGTKGDRWDDFLSAEAQRKTNSQPQPTSEDINAINEQLCQNQKWLHLLPRGKLVFSHELPKLLHATVRCEATDRRDKIYALLGLFPDAKQAELTADYSLSEEQVFSGLTAYLLSKSTAFLLPVFAALQPTFSTPSPSWAVDWSSATNLDCMGPYLAERYAQLMARSDSGSVAYIPRFHQNGLLVLRGRLVTGLSSCVFEPECQRGPPGVLGQVFYGARGTQVPEILPNWAEPTDEICQIQGLDDHALVLRPVMKAYKTYRFVAICKQPVFHRLSSFLDSIDRTAVLLFSTWSYILRAEMKDQLWFLAETWDTVEAICGKIKHFWDLEKTPFRSSGSSRDPRLGKKSSCEEEVQAAPHKLGNPNPREMRSQHEEAPSDSRQQGVADQLLSKKTIFDSVVHQPCFDKTSKIRKFRRTAASETNPFGSLGEHLSNAVMQFRHSRNPGWKTLSDLKPRTRRNYDSRSLRVMTILDWELGSFTGISAAEKMALGRRAPGIHKHKFPWHFTNLEMEATKTLMSFIGFAGKGILWKERSRFESPNEFAVTLLGQGLGEKLTFLLQSTRHVQDKNVRAKLDRDEVFPWLQDALNLESRPLSTKGSYENAYLDTWAADFIRTWTLLTKNVRPRGFRVEEPADLPPKEMEERLLLEQGYLAAAEAKWAPLLDLVKQTEARLLPMKEAFIRARDTHDESMDDVPWEDIFIA